MGARKNDRRHLANPKFDWFFGRPFNPSDIRGDIPKVSSNDPNNIICECLGPLSSRYRVLAARGRYHGRCYKPGVKHVRLWFKNHKLTAGKIFDIKEVDD